MELDEEDTATIHAILSDYERCDIYNMDETWRKAPTTTLATEAQPAVKRNKSRITAYMCSNVDESDEVRVVF